MRIPTSYNQITLVKYQECYNLINSKDEDKWIKILAILSNKSIEEIENLPADKLIKYSHSLKFLSNPDINTKPKKYIGIKGKLFKATLAITDLSTAQGIDIKTFLKPIGNKSQDELSIVNAHLILASIYKPLKWMRFKYDPINHSKNAELFKQVKMGDISGTLFFYSNVWERWMRVINAFTKEADTILTNHMEEVMEWAGSVNTGDGKPSYTKLQREV